MRSLGVFLSAVGRCGRFRHRSDPGIREVIAALSFSGPSFSLRRECTYRSPLLGPQRGRGLPAPGKVTTVPVCSTFSLTLWSPCLECDSKA